MKLVIVLLAGTALLPAQWRKFGPGEVSVTHSVRPAQPAQPAQPAAARPFELPAGMLMYLRAGEHLRSKLLQPNEPVLFEVASAVRPFRSGPALPAGALIAARVVEARPAGRIVGKATLDLTFDEILLPSGEKYPLAAKIVDAKGLGIDSTGKLIGRGHAKADAFFYAFPVTSPLRVMMIPARGPDIRFTAEQMITIKLMAPVVLGGE